VAKVYPELVIHGADGRINGVRYEELAPLLLNVVQQQRARLAAGNRQIEELRQQQAELVAEGKRSEDLQQQLEQVQRLKKQFTELAERYRGDAG
jgi:tRNA uridine 5-carbamoylmethylation protein Kti12